MAWLRGEEALKYAERNGLAVTMSGTLITSPSSARVILARVREKEPKRATDMLQEVFVKSVVGTVAA